MVYINIPYTRDNDLLDKDLLIKELKFIDVSEDVRYEAFAAIYNRLPRGVPFEIHETDQARLLVSVLLNMRIGYRITAESEYK